MKVFSRVRLTVILCSLPVAIAAQGNASPVDVVAQLYRDYQWEVEPPRPGPTEVHQSLLDAPREVLAKYFDDELVQLLLKDRACREEGDICSLDGSPIWASNDPAASDLKVSAGEDSTQVVVTFRYPSTGELVKLQYQMLLTPSGWRIGDILYTDGHSLLKMLEAGNDAEPGREINCA